MSKKIICVVAIVLVLMLGVGATCAFAVGAFDKPGYVDIDKDGICDNLNNTAVNKGRNYADADGDGVCDNKTDNTCVAGRSGNGNCNGTGQSIRACDGTGYGKTEGRGNGFGNGKGCR